MSNTGKLYGKLLISARIYCKTGLHIGAGSDSMEIGGVDNAVVRDPLTREPYIPGSSIKGKMRSLLERQIFATRRHDLTVDRFFNRRISGSETEVRHHECDDPVCPVCRLFGASKGKGSEGNHVRENRPARLIVSDSPLCPDSKRQLEQIDTALYLTELKYENGLDRITSAANPRPQERVPRGAEFELSMIYTADVPPSDEAFKDDVRHIFNCLMLLQDDALGGSGSRGYGRVLLHRFVARFRPVQFYETGEGELVIEQGENESLKEYSRRLISSL